MSNQEAVNHLAKLLKLQQSYLCASTDDLIAHISGENLPQKKSTATAVLRQIQEIKNLAPKSKIPNWLTELEGILTEYSQSIIDSQTFIRAFLNVVSEVKNHQWVLDASSPTGFNFEEIFNDCRANSRIPELFDSIIDLLEQIHDCDELDSRNMADALSKVIATLQVGKTSSCFSLDGSWQFLCSFLEHYLWAEAKKIPGLGSVVEALETTINETREELAKLNTEVQTSMTSRVKQEVKLIQKSDTPIFRAYGKSGKLISAQESSNSNEEYVV